MISLIYLSLLPCISGSSTIAVIRSLLYPPNIIISDNLPIRSKMAVAQVQGWVRLCLTRPDVFESVITYIETHCSQGAGNMQELKKRSTKQKGDLFEAFCLLYLKATLPASGVYLLKDVPEAMRGSLSLPKQDLGIDIVIVSVEGKATAVQCKYRNCPSTLRKRYVKYDELSTFIGTCARTGPWTTHVVMTNCYGVSWKGFKRSNDKTIARKIFTTTGLGVWTSMAGFAGYSMISKEGMSAVHSRLPAAMPSVSVLPIPREGKIEAISRESRPSIPREGKDEAISVPEADKISIPHITVSTHREQLAKKRAAFYDKTK